MDDYKTWHVGENVFFLDLQDVESMERYENAFELLNEEEKARPDSGKASERIRAYCQMYRRLYDRIFGEGTAEKVFDGVAMNADLYDEIFLSFVEFVQKQTVQTSAKKADMLARLSKFTPARK